MAANVVGVIDSNRFVELVFSDLFSMIFPRTAIAYHERGSDDARETFIREFSGLVGNMFVVGWASQALGAALGKKVNAYNPHGIPAKAWVSATNLDVFSDLYKASLQKAHSPQDAREHFIRTILAGLESGDRQFSIEGRLANLQSLNKERTSLLEQARTTPHKASELHKKAQALGQAIDNDLVQMVETVHGKADTSKILAEYQTLFQAGNTKALKEKFLQNGWGRLSPESQIKLAKYYELAPGLKPGIKGTHNFDIATQCRIEGDLKSQIKEQRAAFRAKLNQKHLPHEQANKELEKFEAQLFAKHRLDLSLTDLGKPTEEFTELLGKKALKRGLTGTIHLRDPQTDTPEVRVLLSAEQRRNTFLKELKFFLEQYVDRASYKLDEAPVDWKAQIQQRLFNKHTLEWHNPKTWLNPVWPSLEDGLITASRKSKFMYTALPMFTAIMTAGAFTFFNQWLTRRKHGGKIFFPGEGVPPLELGAGKLPPIAAGRNNPSQALAFSSTYKPITGTPVPATCYYPAYPTSPTRTLPGGILA